MPLMVTMTCDATEDCDAYEEASAGIEDGVNIIETYAEGWVFSGGEAFCPDHADHADD